MSKDNLVYLRHILDATVRIGEYTEGFSADDFLKNRLVQAGVIRELEIIGEATKQISKELKDEYPATPWKKMAGIRDKLIHQYFGVDLKLIWDTVEVEIPVLKNKIEAILQFIS
ncbi:MAG: DUF86 domain-containing protein [Nitrospirae bacterium]|nr:DUF86 domain-containing protein [Nitrospirota bacterium]